MLLLTELGLLSLIGYRVLLSQVGFQPDRLCCLSYILYSLLARWVPAEIARLLRGKCLAFSFLTLTGYAPAVGARLSPLTGYASAVGLGFLQEKILLSELDV